MVIRLGITALLLGMAGCVSDPKVDPCRNRTERSALCDGDAASAPDGDAASARDGGGRDAAVDSQVTTDAEAGVQPRIDAGPSPDVDAARNFDGGPMDASRPPRDAAPRDDAAPRTLTLQGDLGVHDPSIIEADGTFTIVSTGPGLRVKRSSDLSTWSDVGSVFAANPPWIANEVPGATDLWAPDIAFFGGKYHLYYSASTFGSRNSCIGHATTTDLPALSFVDQGPVVCTEQSDDYNAIDPAFVVDESGTPWLSFGSFWSGIKLIQLDAEGQRAGTEMYALASRDTVEAIEAPYIVRRGGYYYLFASFDLCCRGSSSTYRIMVGRADNVAGPYVDADGKPMLSQGGGTMVVLGNQRWRGPGHNGVLSVAAEQYLVYHAYDATRGGAPTLRIAELLWDSNGWPLPVGP
jgi:arabinan endo-1,5-alpha-L-arabinosidase